MTDPVQLHVHIQIQAAAGDRDYLKAAQWARRLRRILSAPDGVEVTEECGPEEEMGIAVVAGAQ